MPPPTDLARRVEAEFRRAGSPERAAGEKAYLKSDLAFLGVRLADIRRVTKEASKGLDHETALELAEALWEKPLFERRMAAVIVLQLHASRLTRRDLKLIERLIRESRTWALVDGLAGDVVGAMTVRLPIRPTLDRWAKDRDFWIRRSSLLGELKPLKQGADFEPFARRADAMLDETEFFIRKAIGWVLREMSKQRPDEVYGWIGARTDRASGVTMREAVKYLAPARAARLMHAYKDGRRAL
jgi:3-methyladenine DNA glycosylase AlkD